MFSSTAADLRPNSVAGERALLPHHDDVEIRFAFTADFPALLRHDDTLDEQDWADISRQRNRELRRRAIASRVLLRRSLTDMFGNRVRPPEWRFARTSHGKLILAGDGQPQVDFSISHTRGVSTIAISKSAPVGIDIEAMDGEVDTDALATGLSRRELSVVDRLGPLARSQAMLKLWTLKEAYTKLIGIGLSAHVPSYEFLADPAQPGQYRGTEEHALHTRLETWFMESPHGKFCVSVAVGNSATR